jgi:VWFA-related protein
MRALAAGAGLTLVLAGPRVAGQQPSPPPRFPGAVDLVTVDVVVLDKQGQPVRGLTAEDFVVSEEGRQQAIATFEAAEVPEAPPETAPPPRVRTRVTTNVARPTVGGRTFAIVFDNVHLVPVQADRVKAQLADFVKTGLRPGDQVLFLATGGGAWWTAHMPEGQADLVAALDRVEGLRPARVGPDHVSDYEAIRIHQHRDERLGAEVSRRFYENGALAQNAYPTAQEGASLADRQFIAELVGQGHPLVRAKATEVYLQMKGRQKATLHALERALIGLHEQRGRKTVLLVSEGFIHDPTEPAFARVNEAALRANAVLYFLDARTGPGADTSTAELGRAIDIRDIGTTLDKFAQEATGAISVAAESGGERLGTAATLADNLRRVAGESRAYYLIGYAPAAAGDGAFRKIKVDVKRPGLTVRARRGYYARKEGEPASPAAGDLDPEVQRALDSPYAGQAIPLRMASYVVGPAADGKAKVLVVAEADPRAIGFESREGRDTDTLESFFLVSSRTGESYNHQSKLDLNLPPETRSQLEVTWLPLQHVFELPPGAYQVRFALRDRNKGQTGTVTHTFDVEDPGKLWVTTPVLTDSLVASAGKDPRPALLARRTFAAGGKIFAQFEAHGAQPDPATGQPRIAAGHILRRVDGPTLSRLEPTPVPPGPQGQLSRLLAISLRTTTAGPHELVLTVRDDVANTSVELREPFDVEGVAPPPDAQVARPPVAPPVASLNVPPGPAGYRQLVTAYASSPGPAVAALAGWPQEVRRSAVQSFRQEMSREMQGKALLAAALLHTEAGDLVTARDLIDLVKDPEAKRRWLLVAGHRFQNASRLEEAAKLYEEGLKLDAKDAGLHLALGSVEEIRATLGLVSPVLGRDAPPAGSESLTRFQGQAERERFARLAHDHYRAALAAEPGLMEARLRLGRVLHRLGRSDDAIEQLVQVVAAKPEPRVLVLAHLFLGNVHEGAGRLPQAVQQYRKALEADARSQTAALALSHALGRSGERSESAEVMRSALAPGRRSTGDAWLLYHIGLPTLYESTLQQLREKARS